MIVLMKGLNEFDYVDKIIGDIHDEDWVSRIIVIDGDSTDGTINELKRFKKCEIYIHKWEDWYHDQEIIQSNIALSYVPHGDICFILDFDEKCSPELKNFLAEVDKKGMPGNTDTLHVSRKSYELMREDDSTIAIESGDGWWIKSRQIGQYPDYQLRIIRRKLGMHWINSPHHMLFGLREGLWTTSNIDSDLIHYHGKIDSRDRDKIEINWLKMQARRRFLGLTADVFESKVPPEMAKYLEPEYWGWK